MLYYNVAKYDSNNNVINYGQMSEEDMKIVTKGYKQDELITDFYSRKGSKSYFIVEEVS